MWKPSSSRYGVRPASLEYSVTTFEPGREARLHPWPAREPALDRLLRQQPGGDHHLRVRGVRAARDRGDDDGAVVELEALAVELAPDGFPTLRRRRGTATAARGRELLVAGRLCVGGSLAGKLSATASSSRRCRSRRRRSAAREERLLRVAKRHAVLRPARPGEARLDGREVELDDVSSRSGCVVGVVPEQVLLAVRLDERDLLVAPPGEAQVRRASPRRPGRSRTSRRTRATCSRASRGRRPAGRRGRRRSTRRTSRRRRSRAGSASPSARGRSPSRLRAARRSSLKPTTCGTSIETDSPSIAASASIPPTPQPSTPSPLIIVVCESVPTSVSGNARPSRVARPRARGTRGSPGGRSLCSAGTTLSPSNACWPQRRNA